MTIQLSISPNENIPFEVVYEDKYFIALSKPAGVVTQPGDKHNHDTLLNGAFSQWGKQLQNLGKRRDFGLLHRLDRDTSGLVLIALTATAYDGLRQCFEKQEITKRYWAILEGNLIPAHGSCSLRIAEEQVKGHKRAKVISAELPHFVAQRSKAPSKTREQLRKIHQSSRSQSSSRTTTSRVHHIGQPALTLYQTLQTNRYQGHSTSLIRCEIKTGRLHQIRAHMCALGAPVIGDFVYGSKTPLNLIARELGRKNLALHAGYLSFLHPCTQVPLELYAPASTWLHTLGAQFGLSLPEELSIKK